MWQETRRHPGTRPGQPEIPALGHSEVENDYGFAFEIAFGKGGVLEGEPLFPTLPQLVDFIERIVDIFDRRVF